MNRVETAAIDVLPKPSTDLVAVETLRASEVFAPGGVEKLLAKVTADVRALNVLDATTEGGRTEIKSLAYKVARSKTALDDMGKEFVAELKRAASTIDADRRMIRDRLDALRDEVRKPVDEWEAIEKDRVAAHAKSIADLEALLDFGGQEPSAAQLQERIDIFAATPAREELSLLSLRVGKRLEDLHVAAVKREAERAELERLRREQTEREQLERDERIAAEAAERARSEAEAKAKREAEQAAERAAAEQRRLDQELAAANARAAKAEQDRIAAERKAADDAKAAAEAAESDRLLAIGAERKRVADAKAREDAETAKREADKKHKAKINSEVLAAFRAAGLTDAAGKMATTALAQGKIPHAKLLY
jgi:hypothetical protein